MKYLIAIVITLSFLAGCGQNDQNNRQKENSEETTQAQQKKETKQHEADSDGTTLQLNDGQKWETDLSTRKGMQQIDSILTIYRNKGALSIEDYNALGKKLKSEMEELIQKCSMEGPAHEELHKFIAKVQPHIQNLNGDEKRAARESFQKLQTLIGVYPDYFQ